MELASALGRLSSLNGVATIAAQSAALRSMVRALIADDATADDVVQETWLAAMEYPERPGFAPGAWLRGIARNIVRHMRRGDRARTRRESTSARREQVPATV